MVICLLCVSLTIRAFQNILKYSQLLSLTAGAAQHVVLENRKSRERSGNLPDIRGPSALTLRYLPIHTPIPIPIPIFPGGKMVW